MQVDGIGTAEFERLAAALNAPAKDTHRSMTDMATRVGRVGDDGITAAQPAQRDSRVGGIAANGTYIGLFHVKKTKNLACGHALDLVDVARPLIITIDFITLIGMPFGIAAHKVGNLDAAHSLARSVLTGNQIDGLCLSPGIFACDDIFDVADIYCHSSLHYTVKALIK